MKKTGTCLSMLFDTKILWLTLGLSIGGSAAWAQQPTRPTPPPREGEVDDQEITIEKSRRIELPPANRIFNKIPSLKQSEEQRKVTYEFTDRPLTVGPVRQSPNALPVQTGEAETQAQYNNYVKVGAGNYGTFFGEAFGSGQLQENIRLGGSFRQFSSSLGPVDGKNSAVNETRLKLNGAYLTNSMKFTADFGFDRDVYYFYGYRRPREVVRDTIRQRLNTTNFRIAVENLDPDNNIDYALKTGVTALQDNFNASEIEWATNFSGSVGISERFVALVSADAFVGQRTDGPVTNRNLFRVKPTFKYATSFITITAGVNAVNETDNQTNLNRTRAFPIVDLDIVPVGNLHFFAGVNGDIVRNTLRGFLNENRWLAPTIPLANTQKTLDFYGGSKGEIGSGVNYEARVSYAEYRNFYVYNNTWPDVSRFYVLYDTGKARVLTISAQLGYAYKELFRTTLKGDVFDYGMDRLEEAWHRPRVAATWSNSLIVNKKLFVTTDLYYLQGMQAKDFTLNRQITLQPIWDMNLKIDYFLGKQVSAFVSLNNIFGRNYQRYLYYPQQGLNFLGGLSYTF